MNYDTSTADAWDAEAATFDLQPDHGLADPATRRVWSELLDTVVPRGARVLDAGCGTGTLAVLLAAAGRSVVGVDIAPQMIARARAKAVAAGLDIDLRVGDVGDPQVDGRFEAVLCRHVLWALPDPVDALVRWNRLTGGAGVVVAIEGRWQTGAGLEAEETAALFRAAGLEPSVTVLDDPGYWGGPITDERYLIAARSVAGADRR